MIVKIEIKTTNSAKQICSLKTKSHRTILCIFSDNYKLAFHPFKVNQKWQKLFKHNLQIHLCKLPRDAPPNNFSSQQDSANHFHLGFCRMADDNG